LLFALCSLLRKRKLSTIIRQFMKGYYDNCMFKIFCGGFVINQMGNLKGKYALLIQQIVVVATVC
jgi:hypothetical protein